MEQLTQTDIDQIKYFWQEKEDIERYINFEELKPEIQKKFPELLKAWNDYKAARKIMYLVINSLILNEE